MSRRFVDIPFSTPLPNDILSAPSVLFATELVHCMACELRTGWRPPTLPNFLTSDLSPFNMAMRRAVLTLLRGSSGDYNVKYETLVNRNPDDKLAQFTNYSRYVLSAVVYENREVSQIFLEILYLARLSFLFYERGTLDAPTFATIQISIAVHKMSIKTDGHIYDMFSNFAEKVNTGQT